MAVNKLVSIKGPVYEAMQDMGIDITRDIPTFTRWAIRAEEQIGSYYSYCKKIAVLDVVNCRVKLPDSASYVQRVILGDYGCECDDLFYLTCSNGLTGASSASQGFLIIDAGSENQKALGSGVNWQVQDNHIVLTSSHDGEKVTVQYLGLEEDADGFPRVSENHIEAIIEYIMYRYAKRSRFTNKKMERTEVQDYWHEWMRLASHSRAADDEISESDRREIVSLLHDPLSGFGMEVGMHDADDYVYGIYGGSNGGY